MTGLIVLVGLKTWLDWNLGEVKVRKRRDGGKINCKLKFTSKVRRNEAWHLPREVNLVSRFKVLTERSPIPTRSFRLNEGKSRAKVCLFQESRRDLGLLG